jgi:hypothetical protein
MLELSFRTRDLRNLCEDDTLAAQVLGPVGAEALRHRLEDLRAADSVLDLFVGQIRVDAASEHGSACLLDLAGGWILRLGVGHPTPPLSSAGAVEWRIVSRVLIMDISKADEAVEQAPGA